MKAAVSINKMLYQSLIQSIKLMDGMDTGQTEAFRGGGRGRHHDRGCAPPGPCAIGREHGHRPAGGRSGAGAVRPCGTPCAAHGRRRGHAAGGPVPAAPGPGHGPPRTRPGRRRAGAPGRCAGRGIALCAAGPAVQGAGGTLSGHGTDRAERHGLRSGRACGGAACTGRLPVRPSACAGHLCPAPYRQRAADHLRGQGPCARWRRALDAQAAGRAPPVADAHRGRGGHRAQSRRLALQQLLCDCRHGGRRPGLGHPAGQYCRVRRSGCASAWPSCWP